MTLAHTSQQRVARDRGGDAASPAASMSSGVVQANVADGVVPAVIAAGLVTCPIVNTRVRPRCRQAPQFGFVEDLLPHIPCRAPRVRGRLPTLGPTHRIAQITVLPAVHPIHCSRYIRRREVAEVGLALRRLQRPDHLLRHSIPLHLIPAHKHHKPRRHAGTLQPIEVLRRRLACLQALGETRRGLQQCGWREERTRRREGDSLSIISAAVPKQKQKTLGLLGKFQY